jgi:hypothetical protein
LSCISQLKAGGYIELHEIQFPPKSLDEEQMPDEKPALLQWGYVTHPQ